MARAVQVQDSERQRERWERNQADTPFRMVERSRIIPMSADRLSHAEQARRLGVDRQLRGHHFRGSLESSAASSRHSF